MTVWKFALIIGIVYLIAGVSGFVPTLLRPVPDTAPPIAITAFYGVALGLFPVNFLHSLVHLAVGAWGIAASRSTRGGARAFAKTLAVFYGVLAVMGLIPTLNTVFGLIPLHGHDVWLHAGTAAIAVYLGWVHTATEAGSPKVAH